MKGTGVIPTQPAHPGAAGCSRAAEIGGVVPRQGTPPAGRELWRRAPVPVIYGGHQPRRRRGRDGCGAACRDGCGEQPRPRRLLISRFGLMRNCSSR